MKRLLIYITLFSTFLFLNCQINKFVRMTEPEFPKELVDFIPFESDSVFSGTGAATWDKMIRERGFILKEGKQWRLWYTGYNPDSSDMKYLGLATSRDGVHWKRYPHNPIYRDTWVEDMMVVKNNGKYYMFAEGRNDIAHWLISTDGIHWKEQGNLDIRQTNGAPISPGPYGTPTVWVENNMWYLFYERDDQGIWLAISTNPAHWKNVSDDPVITKGPKPYDKYAVAMDCIIKYKGRYYGYYHATGDKEWRDWSSDVAVSTDLVHWKKYPKNPIIENNRSSPILVWDGTEYRLYTMHPAVYIYLSKG